MRAATRHAARIAHVHCKDVRRAVLARSLNRDSSFLDAVLDGVFTVPGDGSVDYPAVLAPIARVQAMQQLGGWRTRQFVRLNNLTARQYVGSLIVGDGNKRYYEAAPGRNWMAGVSAQYTFR